MDTIKHFNGDVKGSRREVGTLSKRPLRNFKDMVNFSGPHAKFINQFPDPAEVSTLLHLNLSLNPDLSPMGGLFKR